MAFPDPIVSGEVLIPSGIRSDNYIQGVSGWRVGKDGTAQFDNIVLLGTGTISLESSNYVPGVSGWIIDSDGTAQFADVKLAGSFSSTDLASGAAVRIDGSEDSAWFPGNQVGIRFDTGDTGFNPAYLSMAIDSTIDAAGTLFLQGGGSAPTDDPGNSAGLILGPEFFQLSQGTAAYQNGIFLNAGPLSQGQNNLVLSAVGDIHLQSSGDSVETPDPGSIYFSGQSVQSNILGAFRVSALYMDMASTPIRYGYGTTTTNAANVFIQTASPFEMRRVSSARKYKTDIKDAIDGLEALNLRPRTWIDKQEPAERIPGVVAEEVVDAGLGQYVVYGDEGVEAVMYDRLWLSLLPVIRELWEWKSRQNM